MAYASTLNWQDAFLMALSDTLVNVLSFLPTILASILVFIVGLVLAKWARTIVIKVLKAIRLSDLVKKSGLDPFLEKAELKIKVEYFFGGLVRWLIILVFFIATINVLGLSTVSVVLNSILGYIPRVISAVLVLTIGVLLAGLVEGVVKGALGQVDVKASRLMAKIASYVVIVFASLAAINELKIAQSLINTLFMGFVAMLALGVGLAIGLGSKDLVSRALTDWYENFKKEVKKK
ncbi:hypothetical protein COT75_03685 [Candidatus Beckwithbacteria bacterium CG10_big_fil_rev_8_21_14_0_10_34_10]|uniref:Small-conductance mechanosensitive ion channel n=1 Tax=Candidatus Beckwithbacteria bacterium CG10_big_fil_rev_8_21_14_0_10_34_10 TaxID=1974495 RepID=A0A2H0WAJ6_9BACT|nr:MAG: hypothetical protein COT75_03685 [Candidatus Beckwithbacteria bacterium CG10_big_fil_rev_8_21_14_0_10_34_10]